jgi:two-component system cell cycle response regulator
MSGRILIVDSVATNRIVLRVKLLAAQYQVLPCASVAEAQAAIAAELPDLILIETTAPASQERAFCAGLKADPATAAIPIIATGFFDSPDERLVVLAAGADDVLEKPMADALLQARIRSLLRARDTDAELRLRDDTSRALGFAETGSEFSRAGRVIAIPDPQFGQSAQWCSFSNELGFDVELVESDRALSLVVDTAEPDVFVIGTSPSAASDDMGRVFRLIADLRSRSATRHAAQLIIVPDRTPDVAAMALDLGANDVVAASASPSEIAHRTRRLLQRKIKLDRLRNRVQDGLRAAVTDSLTGLYNRRYALPHLANMAELARASGRQFAIMVLDIDHFKAVNDTFGHPAGDTVLVGVAQRLRDNLRAVDLIARIGGEEFLVAMPDTTVEQARVAAERLRQMVKNLPFVIGNTSQPVEVTLSIGVAVGGNDAFGEDDVMQLVNQADAALYDAKSSGRNMVTISRSAA